MPGLADPSISFDLRPVTYPGHEPTYITTQLTTHARSSATHIRSTRKLVGGYSMYEVKSKQEVIDWTYRFMQLFAEHWPAGECEAEIRQIYEAPKFDSNQKETQ
jgi:hypothetical protein